MTKRAVPCRRRSRHDNYLAHLAGWLEFSSILDFYLSFAIRERFTGSLLYLDTPGSFTSVNTAARLALVSLWSISGLLVESIKLCSQFIDLLPRILID